jgi:hypothetical protein
MDKSEEAKNTARLQSKVFGRTVLSGTTYTNNYLCLHILLL